MISRKISFEEEKRQWMNESLKVFSEDSTLSLKYKSLSTIIGDSSNDDLLKINALVQSQLRKRGTQITVALTDDNYKGINALDVNIGNRAQSLAIGKYIKRNYKDLTRQQRKNLVAVLSDNLAETGEEDEEDEDEDEEDEDEDDEEDDEEDEEDDEEDEEDDEDEDEDEEDERQLSIAEQENFKKLYEVDKGIDDDEYNDLLDLLQDGELNEYMDKYEDPVELAIIVKQLQDEGIKPNHVMLYTFNLPLGKDYIIENNGRYGQYVIIVDKKDN